MNLRACIAALLQELQTPENIARIQDLLDRPSDEHLRCVARAFDDWERDYNNVLGSCFIMVMLIPERYGVMARALPINAEYDLLYQTASLRGCRSSSGIDNRRANLINAIISRWPQDKTI